MHYLLVDFTLYEIALILKLILLSSVIGIPYEKDNSFTIRFKGCLSIGISSILCSKTKTKASTYIIKIMIWIIKIKTVVFGCFCSINCKRYLFPVPKKFSWEIDVFNCTPVPEPPNPAPILKFPDIFSSS